MSRVSCIIYDTDPTLSPHCLSHDAAMRSFAATLITLCAVHAQLTVTSAAFLTLQHYVFMRDKTVTERMMKAASRWCQKRGVRSALNALRKLTRPARQNTLDAVHFTPRAWKIAREFSEQVAVGANSHARRVGAQALGVAADVVTRAREVGSDALLSAREVSAAAGLLSVSEKFTEAAGNISDRSWRLAREIDSLVSDSDSGDTLDKSENSQNPLSDEDSMRDTQCRIQRMSVASRRNNRLSKVSRRRNKGRRRNAKSRGSTPPSIVSTSSQSKNSILSAANALMAQGGQLMQFMLSCSPQTNLLSPRIQSGFTPRKMESDLNDESEIAYSEHDSVSDGCTTAIDCLFAPLPLQGVGRVTGCAVHARLGYRDTCMECNTALRLAHTLKVSPTPPHTPQGTTTHSHSNQAIAGLQSQKSVFPTRLSQSHVRTLRTLFSGMLCDVHGCVSIGDLQLLGLARKQNKQSDWWGDLLDSHISKQADSGKKTVCEAEFISWFDGALLEHSAKQLQEASVEADSMVKATFKALCPSTPRYHDLHATSLSSDGFSATPSFK